MQTLFNTLFGFLGILTSWLWAQIEPLLPSILVLAGVWLTQRHERKKLVLSSLVERRIKIIWDFTHNFNCLFNALTMRATHGKSWYGEEVTKSRDKYNTSYYSLSHFLTISDVAVINEFSEYVDGFIEEENPDIDELREKRNQVFAVIKKLVNPSKLSKYY